MVKDIVVNLSSAATTAFAVSVASEFQAHLAGISFLYEPIVLPLTDMGGIPTDYIEAQRSENKQRANDAKVGFDEGVRRAGLSSESRIVNAELAEAPAIFAHMARSFDLAIVGQAAPEHGEIDDLVSEAALFESGHPVVVVPYIQKAPLTLNRMMVCWDGSHNAARAVSDAMPFLAKAKNIDIATITGKRARTMKSPVPMSPSIWRAMALKLS
jgi:hypothetical protein